MNKHWKWVKWAIVAVVVLMLVAGVVRSLSARKGTTAAGALLDLVPARTGAVAAAGIWLVFVAASCSRSSRSRRSDSSDIAFL